MLEASDDAPTRSFHGPRVVEATKCPKCWGAVIMGFGLMGGGFGPYVYCMTSYCTWMMKEQMPEDEE
jgi:hypothetical protein